MYARIAASGGRALTHALTSPRALACRRDMEVPGTWRDLEALASGRRTTDLRPDEGTDGDGGSLLKDLLIDGTTTTLLLDNNNLEEFVLSQLQLRALHTLSLSSNRLRCLDPGIASFSASENSNVTVPKSPETPLTTVALPALPESCFSRKLIRIFARSSSTASFIDSPPLCLVKARRAVVSS